MLALFFSNHKLSPTSMISGLRLHETGNHSWEIGRMTDNVTLCYSRITAMTGYMANGANDNGLCAEDLCEARYILSF
jgi:hypothetical protein